MSPDLPFARSGSAATRHVVIVGGGFAGTLLAINLMRHAGPRVTLVERHAGRVAQGVAYGVAQAEHVLNVRAANMSALSDDPLHFVRWLERKGLGDRTTFVARRIYGDYLRELLAESLVANGDRLAPHHGAVVALDRHDDGYILHLDDGDALHADIAVLALGNLPPHPPLGIDPASMSDGMYVSDPWATEIAHGLSASDTVVLLGTGLTAIDAALSLDAAGFAGTMLAISRRGLTPRAHIDMPAPQGLREKPGGTLSALVGSVRRRSEEIGWRAAIDELRPVTQMMWSGADLATRARFLRHLRPYWDVHRHRLAPGVAARIDALVASKRLTIAGGKPLGLENGILRWRPRGSDSIVETLPARIVNCTGPQGDLLRSDEPLIRHALSTGLIRPDQLRIGLDVDRQSRVVNADGAIERNLYCIGPMTRGSL